MEIFFLIVSLHSYLSGIELHVDVQLIEDTRSAPDPKDYEVVDQDI